MNIFYHKYLYQYFWSLSLEDHDVLYLCVPEEKTKQLLKREGKRLLIDLLMNNTFSKLILPLNFKMEVFLNKGLRSYKFIILSAFFL